MSMLKNNKYQHIIKMLSLFIANFLPDPLAMNLIYYHAQALSFQAFKSIFGISEQLTILFLKQNVINLLFRYFLLAQYS